MPNATPENTSVALCDWHGHLTWSSREPAFLNIGDFVWKSLTEESQEKTKAALARVVTLRENQILEVTNQNGRHFRAWLWPLGSPDAAVCILLIRIPSELMLLTEREKDCMRLLAQGLATRTIAMELDISVSTVHTHMRRARKKLNLPSGEALIGFAARYCNPQMTQMTQMTPSGKDAANDG